MSEGVVGERGCSIYVLVVLQAEVIEARAGALSRSSLCSSAAPVSDDSVLSSLSMLPRMVSILWSAQ